MSVSGVTSSFQVLNQSIGNGTITLALTSGLDFSNLLSGNVATVNFTATGSHGNVCQIAWSSGTKVLSLSPWDGATEDVAFYGAKTGGTVSIQ